MTSIPPTPSRWRSMVRMGALLLLLLALDWTLTIAWWSVSERDVGISDLLLYLLLLPLALALVLLLALKVRRAHQRAPQAGDDPEFAVQPANVTTSSPPLPIVGSWMMTSLGSEPDDVLDALEQRRARPRPDLTLLDQDGFPVMASRIPDLDCEKTEACLATILNASGKTYRSALIRTLTLLATLIEAIAADWPLESGEQHPVERADAMPMLRGRSGTPQPLRDAMQLQLKLMLPESFDADERQIARLYLDHILVQSGLEKLQPETGLLHGTDDTHVLELLQDFRQAKGQQALLILACDSALCSTVVERWQAEERLFDQQHPNGRMPGEAGYALLAVTPAALERANVDPLCTLSRSAFGVRQESADKRGKVSATCLGEQLSAIQEKTEHDTPAVATAICDADHRASRTLECIDAMIEHLPGLDAVRDRFALGETCGCLGAASMPGLIALAAHQVGRASRPVLLFNVGHPTERAAALLEPLPSPPPSPERQAA